MRWLYSGTIPIILRCSGRVVLMLVPESRRPEKKRLHTIPFESREPALTTLFIFPFSKTVRSWRRQERRRRFRASTYRLLLLLHIWHYLIYTRLFCLPLLLIHPVLLLLHCLTPIPHLGEWMKILLYPKAMRHLQSNWNHWNLLL